MREKTQDFFEKTANIAKHTLDCDKAGQKGIGNIFSLPYGFLAPVSHPWYQVHTISLCHLPPASGTTQTLPCEVHRNILLCSKLVPGTFCWQCHQPQPSLLESSFLIFLCISLPGFCLFYLVLTVLP